MGTWGIGPFQNDAAADFCGGLEKAKTASSLTKLFGKPADLCAEDDDAQVAIAAASILMKSCDKSLRGLPKEATAFLKRVGFSPKKADLVKAQKALSEILKKSELRDLWEESDEFEKWKGTVEELIAGLKERESVELPVRKAVAPSLPNKLENLVKVENARTDPKVKEKMHRIFQKLEDVNDLSSKVSEMSPLQYAASLGFLDEVKYLVEERDADVNLQSEKYQWSRRLALHQACKHGYEDIVVYLLSKGADPELVSHCENWKEGRALFFALYHGHFDIADILLKHGANLTSKVTMNLRTNHYWNPYSAEPDDQKLVTEENEALDEACVDRKDLVKPILEFLLERGFQPNKCHPICFSPMYWLIMPGRNEDICMMINAGFPVKEACLYPHNSIVFQAVEYNPEALEVFLKVGADPNIVLEWEEEEYVRRQISYPQRYTALDLAIIDKKKEAAAILRKYGAKRLKDL